MGYGPQRLVINRSWLNQGDSNTELILQNVRITCDEITYYVF